jgi:gamma-glutamylcyclotransferase (GGCT)/AIG2-like uncharacterized protein YtfP
MPLIFSYGTLQQEDVQRSMYGRPVNGTPDELPGFEPAEVKIDDPELAAKLGTTHHANAILSTDPARRVTGTVFEVTDAELARTDAYEAPHAYKRIAVTLASGREAWVYVHAR